MLYMLPRVHNYRIAQNLGGKNIGGFGGWTFIRQCFFHQLFWLLKMWSILQGMCPNTVKLPSIFFLIATLCSLMWPDLTAFSFCEGENFSIPTQKMVWLRETIQCACCEDFLLHASLLNLLQQLDYTRQLCIPYINRVGTYTASDKCPRVEEGLTTRD